MWYVMQVTVGKELQIQKQFMEIISINILKQCVVLKYEKFRKVKGRWETILDVFLKGYVFICTEDISRLMAEINRLSINGIKKLLKNGDDFLPLNSNEELFVQKHRKNNYIVTASKGVIKDHELVISSGPLVGMEEYIVKIDRHKRVAWLRINIFGKEQRVKYNLEITSKK